MTLGESRFWDSLWKHYALAPSIAFCRVPELEYASQLKVSPFMLDHCCGDGVFASLAWTGEKIPAGCDINETSVNQARGKNIYARLETCDVSRRTPFAPESFDLIFNNSALEHVPDLDGALVEVRRMLKPGGRFAFNVLNHRYFEWWQVGEAEKQAYREWQPFYHALSLDEWKLKLKNAGMELVSVEGYFDKKSAQKFAYLDYIFSAYYFRGKKNFVVTSTLKFGALAKIYWKINLSQYRWRTDADNGAGYFITAERAE